MKSSIFLLTLLVVATSVYCKHDHQFYKDCKTEAGITDEIKKEKLKNLEDPKVKCFVTCLQKKRGIINAEGKVDQEKLIEKLSKKKELDDAQKEMVKACVEQANGTSECEVGVTLKKCLKEKGLLKKHKHHHSSSTKKPENEEKKSE